MLRLRRQLLPCTPHTPVPLTPSHLFVYLEFIQSTWRINCMPTQETKTPACMQSYICNVNLLKLLIAHKSHVRETSSFTDAIPNQVCNSQTFRFGSRPKSGKVKPRRHPGFSCNRW